MAITDHVRCAVSHGGNTRLTINGAYAECAGCGYLHTVDAVRQTLYEATAPVHGAGGLRVTQAYHEALLAERARIAEIDRAKAMGAKLGHEACEHIARREADRVARESL